MARKPLRSQLNQIRAWVRQGRTDAWIAHQLDVSASELREFRRRHELSPEDEETGEVELRDEIEAEIEALSEAVEEEEAAEAEGEGEEGEAVEKTEEAAAGAERSDGEPSGGRRRRRRRRRRGGGAGDRPGASMEATFDHGDTDGFGLWLDPSVEDDPVYTEHWAGHRRVEVTIEPDRIVVKRV
jgi:hypothetical protein